MKLLFLVDTKAQDIKWMTQHFDDSNYKTLAIAMNSSLKNRTVSWRKSILIYKYIHVSLETLSKSTKEDVIISGNFIVGAFIAFFCKRLSLKRTILSLNMISHEKGLVNKLFRKIVYNTAFKYSKFYTTVNSKELIDQYSKDYDIKKDHFFVLEDPIMNYYEIASFKPGNGTVFCGGEAMRDWKTLFKSAQLLPNVKFVAIARKIYFDNTLKVPENVTLYFDKTYDFFYDRLKESSIVAMPLSTTAPAGLIVMIRSAMLSKPIIVTSTSSTRNYIEHNFNGILIGVGEEQKLADQISLLLSDIKIQERLCVNMSETIKSFSLDNFSRKLENMILKIKN